MNARVKRAMSRTTCKIPSTWGFGIIALTQPDLRMLPSDACGMWSLRITQATATCVLWRCVVAIMHQDAISLLTLHTITKTYMNGIGSR